MGVVPEARVRRAPLTGVTVWLTAVFVANMARGGFVWDDLINFRVAQTTHFSWTYLTSPVFEQFAPGHHVFDWLIQHAFPMDFGAAIAISTVFYVASIVLMALLLGELFGPGRLQVLLTAVFGGSVVNIGTAQWWAAGLHKLPVTVCVLASLLAFVRFHRRGRRANLALSVIAMAIGTLFSFTALFTPLYLVLLVVLILEPSPHTHRLRTWIPYAVVGVIAVTAYLVYVSAPLKYSGPLDVAHYAADAWTVAFVPATVGLVTPFGRLPQVWVSLLTSLQLVAAAVVAWSLVRKRSAWRAWLFFLVAGLANLAFTGLTRVNGASPALIAHGYRYLTDVNLLFVIALGAAFAGASRPAPRMSAAVALVLLELVITWAGSVVVSRSTSWFGPQAKAYAARLRAGVDTARAHGPVTVVDGTVPEYMVPAQFAPYNWYAEVLPLFDSHIRTGIDGPLWQVTPAGGLVPVSWEPHTDADVASLRFTSALTFVGGTLSTAGDAVCVGTGTTEAVASLHLGPLGAGNWHLVVEYTASADGGLSVAVDRGAGPVPGPDPITPVRRGPGLAVADVGGTQLEVIDIGLPLQSTVCLDRIEVGRLVPRAVQ